MFFTNQAHIRINRETIKKIDELLKAFPEDFTYQSDVVRAGIHHLHRTRIERNEEE